ncbi:hypothetical protein GINT2_001018 [Glugoides intestinalis]
MRNIFFKTFRIVFFLNNIIACDPTCILPKNLSSIRGLQQNPVDGTINCTLNTKKIVINNVCEDCKNNIEQISNLIDLTQVNIFSSLEKYGKPNVFIYSCKGFANEYPILNINNKRYFICREIEKNSSKIALIPCKKTENLGKGILSTFILYASPSYKYQLLLQGIITDNNKICNLINNANASFEKVDKNTMEVVTTIYDLYHKPCILDNSTTGVSELEKARKSRL